MIYNASLSVFPRPGLQSLPGFFYPRRPGMTLLVGIYIRVVGSTMMTLSAAATRACNPSTISRSITTAIRCCSRLAIASTATRTLGAGHSRHDDDQELRLRGDMVGHVLLCDGISGAPLIVW